LPSEVCDNLLAHLLADETILCYGTSHRGPHMKPLIVSLLAAAALALPANAADQKANTSGQVEVIFDKPEDFRDVKDSHLGTDKGRDANLAQFRSYLEERAPRYLAPGQKLTVTFTDIDMAGEFEPWHGPTAQDVRIIKAIYVPRMELTYRVTDANGAVVKEGKSKLTDLNFQMNVSTATTTDPLRYEKRLLDDWLRNELRGLKK
jgi:hypothetical protein